MPMQWGPTKIGAMQFNGHTIGEAMIDGQIVYRSVIRVTPAAPTFHDGEPWITLPTVEGVTYSVSGTPGYDASVTVTATAQSGYELVGTASWSHTYGPPPRYVASNSNSSRVRINTNTWTTLSSHTVASDGVAAGHWQAEWRFTGGTGFTHSVRVRRGTTTIATDDFVGTSIWGHVQRVTIPTTILNAGDSLTFQARTTAGIAQNRDIESWSWSLS